MDTPSTATPSSDNGSLPSPASDTSLLVVYNFSAPLDDADLLLRTADDVPLYAHRLILRRVSPVLAACIASALPAPVPADPHAPHLPAIQLPAPARIVDALLTYIYPEFTPDEPTQFADLAALLHLAVTFQIHPAVARLRLALVQPAFLYTHPIRIFSACSAWELLPEAELAAEATGTLDLALLAPTDLAGVSAVDYVRLVKRHKRRKHELVQAIEFWHSRRCKTCQQTNSWASQFRARALQEVQKRPTTHAIFSDEFLHRLAPPAATCPHCDSHFAFLEGWKDLEELSRPAKMSHFSIRLGHARSPSADSQLSLPPIPSFQEGDCILRCSDGAKLLVYQRILMEASAFWKGLFSLPQLPPLPTRKTDDDNDDTPQADAPPLPTIDCQEDSRTLSHLLQIIYPLPNPTFPTLDDLVPVLEAAHKYSMDAALSHLTSVLLSPALLAADPVRLYALAHTYDLPGVARAASRAALRVDLDETGEASVGGLSAAAFMRLMCWRNERAARMRKIMAEQPYPGLLAGGGAGAGHACHVSRDRWTNRWLGLAAAEVARRPVGDTVFSLEFVLQSLEVERAWQSPAGHCCATTVTEGDREWLKAIRRKVEELPEEIDL